MDLDERLQALREAEEVKRGAAPSATVAWRISSALLDSAPREVAYQKRIAELTDALIRTTASGVENAQRYAADLDRERRAGAAAVERIRAALLDGASDERQREALAEALAVVEETTERWAMVPYIARAFLALSASHAEERALLSDIGERARMLLGKAPT